MNYLLRVVVVIPSGDNGGIREQEDEVSGTVPFEIRGSIFWICLCAASWLS